ncbi:hypothetical protein [Parvibacter caecicola]|uniref:hypothetical protein n=1 Tax=Parvibacter caecicola TaxID=747645 RepID=UPI00273194BC|nr:hypothetical protein [Parvibacter caecicola]
MVEVTIAAETLEELAEALRMLAATDKLFVSASEISRAAGMSIEELFSTEQPAA